MGHSPKMEKQTRVFRASRLWEFSVWGAIVAGFLGGVLMAVVALLVLSMSGPSFAAGVIFLALIANFVGGMLALYPGNLVASFPYAVEVELGSGLRLFAPYKEVYLPIHDIQDIRRSWLYQGYVIRLRRRRGLLTQVFIHWFFGAEREALVQAIRQALEGDSAALTRRPE